MTAFNFILFGCMALGTIAQGTNTRENVYINEGYAEVKRNGYEHFDEVEVTPIEIDEDGNPLSNPSSRSKRDLGKTRKHFAFQGFGDHFRLEVEHQEKLLATGFRVYRRGGGETVHERADLEECLFRGRLKDRPLSAVALNLCGGMTGLVKTESSEYLIEPVNKNISDPLAVQKSHRLIKRSVKVEKERIRKEEKHQTHFCGKRKRYMPHLPRRKDHWLPDEFPSANATEHSSSEASMNRVKRRTGEVRHQRRHRRSVETLVVADREMVLKHGTENVTGYLLTVFNMVAMLYQDSTIGNNVSVILVGVVLLEGDEPGLTISHNAESSLSSFCQWQSTIHTSKGGQHDHAVLVTGLDICSWKDEPCDTLGYAPISGMCSRYRSCTVNEDSGLALAFTVAHEIGHNFGMVHDGQGSSPCRRKRGTIMSASLSGLDSSLLWSECSKRDLRTFLQSPRSLCLQNVPDFLDELQFPDTLPGQLYDADMQCRLQFGAKSKLCQHYPRKSEVCRALWCQRSGRECETKFLPAAEGTPCGKNRWCRKGSCVDQEMEALRRTDGGWSPFSPWSNCSRPCGGGLTTRERFCDSPAPKNGGMFCKGEQFEYTICGTQECKPDMEYQNDQCETFNKRTVKGKYYRWKPYGKDLGALSRCRIYCVPDKEDLYLVLSTKLQDGTSCSGNYSGVCIDGECRAVGCDGKIDSSVTPDLCGVCNGDNSTCKTIKGSFNAENLTTGYHQVIRLPMNSRHINISERKEHSSFLAIRDTKGHYFLNENWILDWPGRYNAAGTTFSYRRWPGNPESLVAKGPTTDEIIVEVLVQEKTKSIIDYQFVVSAIQARWKMQNSSCSITCGNGTYQSSPVCVLISEGIVNDLYCDTLTKPKTYSYPCFKNHCLPRWSVGEWSSCNTDQCEQTRKVFCAVNQTNFLESECTSEEKPTEVRQCPQSKCSYIWHSGPWSSCRGPCKSEFQTRSVTCRRRNGTAAESFSHCQGSGRPNHTRKCRSANCILMGPKDFPSVWLAGGWSQCSAECGEGEETRNVTCIKKSKDVVYPSTECAQQAKPHSRQTCTGVNCRRNTECEDFYKWCPTSTNQKLCKLKFYSENCCVSCRRK